MVIKYLSYLYSANNNIMMLTKLDIPMFMPIFSVAIAVKIYAI